MQRYYFILCLSLLCSLWFFACQPKAEQPATGNNSIDSAQGAAKDEVKEEVEEKDKDDVAQKDKDDVAQQAVEEPSAEAHLLDGSIDEWVDANNRFAWQALKTFPAGKNVVFSPYSFERAMGMTITGARGETRAELLKTMGFERDSANRDALSLQIEKSIFDAPAKGVLLRIANKIYPAKRYSFLPEFMEGLKANYRIAIEPLDFEAAPEPSRQKINRWVAEKTSNKIQGLLPSGSIDEYTRMVLVNAIYLKAPWEIPFKKSETRNESFKGLRNKKKVPTMHRLDNMEVFIGRNYKALTLYYKNSPLSMLLVLPNEGYALANLEDELKAEDFRMMLNRKQMRFVKLALPKFRQELKVDGKGMLETLGALLAFSDAAADF